VGRSWSNRYVVPAALGEFQSEFGEGQPKSLKFSNLSFVVNLSLAHEICPTPIKEPVVRRKYQKTEFKVRTLTQFCDGVPRQKTDEVSVFEKFNALYPRVPSSSSGLPPLQGDNGSRSLSSSDERFFILADHLVRRL